MEETPTVHRGVDEDGNPDDKFTEKEALAKAKKEGVEFEDFYQVVDQGTLYNGGATTYATLEEAEKERGEGQVVIQGRRQK